MPATPKALRVDSHVHAFPDRLALAVRERMNARGTLTGGVHIADVAVRVQDAGFDRAWILPYAHRPGVAESVNEWSAREVTKFPWLVAGATFHPGDEETPRLVERALVELRLHVVKLHCSVGQFSPDDRNLEPLWRTAAARGVPVVCHAGRESPGETAASELDALIPVLTAHPDLRLVLAHTGFPGAAHAIELMARLDNLYADLTPVWDRRVDVTAEQISRFPGRFLFGSDAPNCPTPADEQAAMVAGLGLSAHALEMVLGGAAEALIPS
jgi:predicted TIM-barrel fold metal-dependent hydrolase